MSKDEKDEVIAVYAIVCHAYANTIRNNRVGALGDKWQDILDRITNYWPGVVQAYHDSLRS